MPETLASGERNFCTQCGATLIEKVYSNTRYVICPESNLSGLHDWDLSRNIHDVFVSKNMRPDVLFDPITGKRKNG